MLLWTRIAALLIGATVGAMPNPGHAHVDPEPSARETPRAELSTEQLLRRADAQRRNGELADAWADLSEASERAPQHPALPHQRALWHLAAGEPTQALAAIESVVANDPANSRAHATRARALDVLGRPALARCRCLGAGDRHHGEAASGVLPGA
jgi:tetratricopeptide (TPR) repeat protein